jgi:hypothetical protein
MRLWPHEYRRLEEVASRHGVDVESVIRDAIAKQVLTPTPEEREAAWDHFLSLDSGIDPGSPEDIKAEIIRGLDEYLDRKLNLDDD